MLLGVALCYVKFFGGWRTRLLLQRGRARTAHTHHRNTPNKPPNKKAFLSRLLLMLGSFVIMCLLLF